MRSPVNHSQANPAQVPPPSSSVQPPLAFPTDKLRTMMQHTATTLQNIHPAIHPGIFHHDEVSTRRKGKHTFHAS